MNKKTKTKRQKTRASAVLRLTWLFVAAALLLGCYESVQWEEIEPIDVQHALSSHGDCGSFTEYGVKAATQLMRAQVEAARDNDAESVSRTTEDNAISPPPESGSANNDMDMDESNGGGQGGSHSETNVQEQGVDEANLVKTDGVHIYTLHLGELVIVEAGEDGQMTEAGRTDVGGYANELFIYNNLAVVFSTLYEDEVPEDLRIKQNNSGGDGAPEPGWGDMECWDEWCFGNSRYAQIALVDIEDRAAPEVVRTIIFAGEYSTSRRIDNALRAVVYSPIPTLEMSWYYEDDDWWGSTSSVNKHYKRVIEKNEERFNTLKLDDILPKKLDSIDGEITYISECNNVLGPTTPSGIGLTTAITIDLDAPTAPQTAVSVFGAKGLVYASTESLFLTTSSSYVVEAFESGLWDSETSGIHKFDISNGGANAKYLATGAVPGRMLDQFCLGEYEGYLRVATTTGSAWGDSPLENHVRVLAQSGNKLEIVGEIDDLGIDQQIYAARFMGDRGYIVTFRQVDPLYTLDMSDPTDPKAIGEWHGPGYSTYLHPVGDNHILSVGMDDWRVTVSLYDITDFADPKLDTRLLFPDDRYSSAGTSNHKAFTFNSETGFLALPFINNDNHDTGIFTYDVQDTGITQLGTLHLNAGIEMDEGAALRSVYIDDTLYGLSRCRITSGYLTDPEPAITTLPLFNKGSCDDYGNQNYGSDW
ncbi:MAG: hypothetical protein GY854_11835 [Deltaproteobacteria bacterium]|nr:hypothetical protein [Deltaproteobacteria bacterium]